ncbi:D-amino-acid oxidase [Penicillium brevicompactum]|uniref:D-amino-acid oxidase n=1 Tax=Penicillium brevicompactum TaxID=5074 RepID=A0A9W9R1R3_PENBR|nr:D-amino-acid oxidase [Penicillium brevicompactum]
MPRQEEAIIPDPEKVQKLEVPKNGISGGAGFNVSTGDSPLEKPKAESPHVLILGGGVSGLFVAWMLLDKGFRVTILAKEWARTWDFSESRITSQIAGALWEMPPGGGGHSFGLSVATLHQFFYEDVISAGDNTSGSNEHHKKFKEVEVKCDDVKSYADSDSDQNAIGNQFGKTLINLAYGGHKFKSGYSHKAPILNTDKSLAYLMALVQRKGATLETRKVKDLRESGQQLLTDYNADVIVNATGLGSKKLLNDQDVYPVRGAIRRVDNVRHGQFRHLNDAYLVPAQIGPDRLPSKTVFIVPRSDDILYVGSIIQPHNEQMNLTPDSPEVQQMWNRAGDFMPSLRHAAFRNHFPFAQGLRPFTKKNVKVRADEDFGFPLVHNYGHGGSGWTLGVGTAQTAVCIVEAILKDKAGFIEAVNLSNENPNEKTKLRKEIENNEILEEGVLSGVINQLADTHSFKAQGLKVVGKFVDENGDKVNGRLSDASAKLINHKLYVENWN